MTQRIGDSLAKDKYFWWNAALPVGEGRRVLRFGGVSHRTGDSAGFFRSAGDGRTVPAVYPNGFLPNIRTTVKDASLAVGYRRDLADHWKFDVSHQPRPQRTRFPRKGTRINVSYWYEPKPGGGIYAESPLEADTGKLKFTPDHRSTPTCAARSNLGGSKVNFATGFEYRRDGYAIDAGDPVSYQYGRTNNPAIVIRDQTGGIAASGTQGFPGYTPATAVDDGRHNIALYADVEHKLTSELLLGAAVRWEKYSDFGSTTTGKLTLRYDPTQTVGLRGTLSTGFRAPGVQQKFYSSVSTNLNAAGVLTETLTAREGSAVTKAFGIPNLKEETSKNASVGIVLRPASNFSLTADLWRIDIDNRIVFSSNIAPESGPCATAAACPIKAILDPLKVGQAQFFTNAIDTETQRPGHRRRAHHALAGFDARAVRPARLQPHQGHGPPFAIAGADRRPAVRRCAGDADRTRPAAPAPRAVGRLHERQWNGNVRANYYGEVQGQGFTAPFVADLGSQVDRRRHAALQLHKSTSLTVGSNNIFNTFPTKWDPVKAAPFPQLGFTYCWETCPFGINGRSWYARVDVAL